MAIGGQVRKIAVVIIALIILAAGYFAEHNVSVRYLPEVIYSLAWICAGINLMISIKSKDSANANILILVLTLLVMCIGKCFEGASAVILVAFGDFLQTMLLNKQKEDLKKIVLTRPKFANVDVNGNVEQVKPEQVVVGDNIIVKTGETIPLDGIIVAGQSTVDWSLLTGEKTIKAVDVGEQVYSGCINTKGLLKIKVNTQFSECAVNKLANIVDNLEQNTSETEKKIKKFAKIYEIFVIIFAILMVAYPVGIYIYNSVAASGFKYGFLAAIANLSSYFDYMLTIMIIANPCVFLLSISAIFFASIKNASKYGIFIRKEQVMEDLSATNILFVDKVATLTKGRYKLERVVPSASVTKEELIQIVLKAVVSSSSAMFAAIRYEFSTNNKKDLYSNASITEIDGKGIWMIDGNTEILVGNKSLMSEYDIPVFYGKQMATNIYVAKNKKYIGCIVLTDSVLQGAKVLVSKLKNMGIKTIMLASDIKENVTNVAKTAEIENIYAGLMNEEKVQKVSTLVKHSRRGKKVAYAGGYLDNVNIFGSANVGIAMGAVGNEPSVQSAGVLVPDENLAKIHLSLNIARITMFTIKINLIIAFIVKVLLIYFACTLKLTMLSILAIDIILSIILIVNGIKLSKLKLK